MSVALEMKANLLLLFFLTEQQTIFGERARICDLVEVRKPQMNLSRIDLLHVRAIRARSY